MMIVIHIVPHARDSSNVAEHDRIVTTSASFGQQQTLLFNISGGYLATVQMQQHPRTLRTKIKSVIFRYTMRKLIRYL